MAEVGFDLAGLRTAVAAYGRVARVVIAAHDGSSPREVGAAMLVWSGGAAGTIGGGALEWEALARAREALATGDRLDKIPLGPALGQCCGGAVLLLTEIWDAVRLPLVTDDVFARPMPGFSTDMPMKVAGRLRLARNGSRPLVAEQIQGWMIEPLARADRALWVWGAGHVGRALVGVLQPLPGLAITWVDVGRERFPEELPGGVTALWAAAAERLADHAPTDAEHLVLTYSHALDLELCHRLLLRGFGGLGLIGSATKWVRFRGRLRALGHGDAAIGRIRCPIGDTSLGKHPQAIAVGVALDVLKHKNKNQTETEIAV
jgi:xanthine dehydrogenase accessory factor